LIQRLRGHTAAVEDATFSPDDNRIVTGSDDMTLRVWDARNGRLLTKLETQDPLSNVRTGVSHVAFSADGKRLLSASAAGYDLGYNEVLPDHSDRKNGRAEYWGLIL